MNDATELCICARCKLPFKPKDRDDTMCPVCIGEYRLQDYEEFLMERGVVR